MRYLLVSCCVLLAACSDGEAREAPRKGPISGPVILECMGKSYTFGGLSAGGQDEPTMNTFRLNKEKGTFETWDGEQFRAWEGKMAVDDFAYWFRTKMPGDANSERILNFIRDDGTMSDVTTSYEDGEKVTRRYDGKCVVVDKPKPNPRMF